MTLQEQLAAKQQEQEPQVPQPQEKSEPQYRSLGSRRGYQCGNRIIRCDVFGVYTPENDEEDAFLASLVEQGTLVKE